MAVSCYRHADREGVYYCQKDGNYMCEECACCHSPRIYCQYRTACVIQALTDIGELEDCAQKGDDDRPTMDQE
jgi:hypothetical protein